MRFKAKLAPEQVSLLYSLISPLSKLGGGSGSGGNDGNNAGGGALRGGGSILYLDNNHLRITSKGRTNDTDGISCFTELTTRDGIFLEHRIESAAEDNVIVMEIDLIQFRMALQSIVAKHNNNNSGHNNDMYYNTAVIKLAKRNNIPCLCLDALARGGGVVEVHHAIPVRIMKATEAQYHLPPQINMPDVQLELPNVSDRPLRIIAERLKQISSHVFIEANLSGDLTLRIDNDGSSIRTFFTKLIPRTQDCRNQDENGNNNTTNNGHAIIKVDTKKFCSCLQWQQPAMIPNVTSALLCLVENEMLVLHVLLNPSRVGFLTYYVPVHYLSGDELDDE